MRDRWIALLFSILLCAPIAYGYCAVPEIKANSEFFQANIVFSGKVLSQRYRDLDDDRSGWFYRVRVKQVFKGPRQKEFIVYTEGASNRFALDVGKEYLLFAYRVHSRLEIEDCGNSALLSKAAKSIEQIQRIPSSKDGEIEGWLVGETSGVNCYGIHVVVRGRSKLYRAVTDEDGYFHFGAPAGRYKVDLSNQEYYVNAGDDFWYNPKGFILHAGESAALQLVSVRHPNQ